MLPFFQEEYYANPKLAYVYRRGCIAQRSRAGAVPAGNTAPRSLGARCRIWPREGIHCRPEDRNRHQQCSGQELQPHGKDVAYKLEEGLKVGDTVKITEQEKAGAKKTIEIAKHSGGGVKHGDSDPKK
jgi:hypothetical protein